MGTGDPKMSASALATNGFCVRVARTGSAAAMATLKAGSEKIAPRDAPVKGVAPSGVRIAPSALKIPEMRLTIPSVVARCSAGGAPAAAKRKTLGTTMELAFGDAVARAKVSTASPV